MAVHPDYPELEVEVVVNDEALLEYNGDEEEENPEVTRYVEASSGASFAVRYTIPSALFTEHSVRAAIEIDCIKMRRSPYNNKRPRPKGVMVTHDTSAVRVNGVDMGQKSQFSEMQLSKYDCSTKQAVF